MTKTDDKKEDNKETKKTTKKEDLKVLYELVQESDKDFGVIVGCLVEAGLYTQYLNEVKAKKHNLPIAPSITEKEFNEIIKLLGV